MNFEEMARLLEESGQYRVLKKLEESGNIAFSQNNHHGLFVDVETTGLDHFEDEIIEICLVRFAYTKEGVVLGVVDTYQSFQMPKKSIPPQIISLTGITNEMVIDQSIDLSSVRKIVEKSEIVVAHNARFDRKFCENLDTCFASKPWVCSLSDVDWYQEGFESNKLSVLAAEQGFFYDRHRALSDCLAGIEVISRPLPRSNTRPLSLLLEKVKLSFWRIWALGSPYDKKDCLKLRGYQWQNSVRSWFVDVLENNLDSELSYLKSEIFNNNHDVPRKLISSFEKFSVRAELPPD